MYVRVSYVGMYVRVSHVCVCSVRVSHVCICSVRVSHVCVCTCVCHMCVYVRACVCHMCVSHVCVVDEFGPWGDCSKDCDGGLKLRTRGVVIAPANGGAPCPHLVEQTNCNDQPCAVDCQVCYPSRSL